MTRLLKIGLPAVALALAVGVGVWYGNRTDDGKPPTSLCGTKVSPILSERLLQAGGKVTEHNRVDRRKPQPSSWCQVLVDGESALAMRFAWHPDAVDPYKVAQSGDSVSNMAAPARLEGDYKAAVGNNGAIFTVQCRTDIGSYFTLTLLLQKGNPVDRAHRKDIEKFMRAYFPATLKTLGCT
ncbi:hypothetical protein [Streptomyces diastatochromogenes]|uniref:hypothetical protein n=1 Tax=Streptomyces diastatochromogenes TaxID=42236 RepID=UPI0036CA76FB